jgi:SNF2 family DNA or RNA helicase
MPHLDDFQRDIVRECEQKRGGGISVPMGTGKTLIALTLAVNAMKGKDASKCLIIVSKTLIESWTSEIVKFFATDLKFQVYHTSIQKSNFATFSPDADTKLIITTPEVLSKFYLANRVATKFVTQEMEDRGGPFPVSVNRYHIPQRPLVTVGSFLFTTQWKRAFIDEIQSYTNITSVRCQAIASVSADQKWGLSGTLFNEPKADRILGYNLIIGNATFPNCLPDAVAYIKRSDFEGLNTTLVLRKSVPFSLPEVNERVIEHNLSVDEQAIYLSFKNVIKTIRERVAFFKTTHDTSMSRKFSAYLLAMITYTRQFLVCPLIPYASMAIELMDLNKKNEMVLDFKRQIDQLNVASYMANPDSAKSTRISRVIETVNSHDTEKVIIFTCFRTNLNVLEAYMPAHRQRFVIASEHPPKKRAQILSDFEKSESGILLLTYELGAEGLNLQHCATVLLVDVWWNCGKTQQAIARVLRRGQTSTVNVYFYTANTGIERALFTKHGQKMQALKELETGPMTCKIETMKTKDILDMINSEDNAQLLKSTRET